MSETQKTIPLTFLLVFLLLALTASPGTFQAFAAEQKLWRGYVVDRQCADSVRDDSDPVSFIKQHTKDCSVMCKSKNFTLYSSSKWFDFDPKGDKLALKVLQSTKKQRGILVEVTGTLKNKTLLVQTMKEITDDKASGPADGDPHGPH
jgi:hypothetical protein